MTNTSENSKVVVLAGGTGGAKLARGMLDVVGAEDLVVIANTGDDIDIYGAHVSPDPDLVSFWLADLINERGWGIEGDTFEVMGALRKLGADVWFNLGDRDLAWCIERRRMEEEGLRPTEALERLNAAIGVRTQVLPMCDEQLRTHIRTNTGWRDFQSFMIADGARGPVLDVEFRESGEKPAVPTPEVLSALRSARAVIVGPSNPVISIWPILHVVGEALRSVQAPVVCVSPVVGGEIVKGPTEVFLAAYNQPASTRGVVAFYETIQPGLLDGVLADEPVSGMEALEIDVGMPEAVQRRRVAEQTLAFTESLAK
ncbi:MAG TPA: 2-phospho-L-lactate transferase CofD family protein [Solirubrobacteraceae bacterium]